MDEEAEDRFTDQARARLADTLSEAARLLSGPSPDAPPIRRTERLGIDEVLLGLPRDRPHGLVPPPEPSGRRPTLEPVASDNVSERDGDVSEAGGEGGELWAEVDRLRVAVDAARQRVDAAEARAEEHEAALGDLRGALSRLRSAEHQAPLYERPGFAAVPGVAADGARPARRVAPLPVVSFALGTILSQPAPTGEAKPETDDAPAPDPATTAAPDREGADVPQAAESPDPGPERAKVSSPESVLAAPEAAAPTEPAIVDVPAAGQGEAALDKAASSEPDQMDPSAPVPSALEPARDREPDGYSWAFGPSPARPARRRFWHRH